MSPGIAIIAAVLPVLMAPTEGGPMFQATGKDIVKWLQKGTVMGEIMNAAKLHFPREIVTTKNVAATIAIEPIKYRPDLEKATNAANTYRILTICLGTLVTLLLVIVVFCFYLIPKRYLDTGAKTVVYRQISTA